MECHGWGKHGKTRESFNDFHGNQRNLLDRFIGDCLNCDPSQTRRSRHGDSLRSVQMTMLGGEGTDHAWGGNYVMIGGQWLQCFSSAAISNGDESAHCCQMVTEF